MKGDYGNLSVRSASEQLQAIYGAKDFLRGTQMECPDMYGYYQKQINELKQDEDELNSWLGENGDYGGDYDYDDGGYDDEVVQEDLAHFNDDLYEDGRASLPDYLKPWYGMTADSCGPVIDSSEASLYNQNRGTNSADEEIARKIYESWYEDEEPGYPSPAPYSSDQVPPSGRIDNDSDGNGMGTYYAPDGSGTSIDDFRAADNEDESDKVDSKTAWEIISDWVKADDGDINNGSFQTDPESGRTYYVSPDGMLTPITAFGVDDGEVPSGSAEGDEKLISGDTYTVNSNVKKYDSENTYSYNHSVKLISVTDSTQTASDNGLEVLSNDTPHTEENKAKYSAVYAANQEEIQMLEEIKRMMAAGAGGVEIYAPDIDKRLIERYIQNQCIDAWRKSVDAKPVEEEKPVEGNDADGDEASTKRNTFAEIAKQQVDENGIGGKGSVYQDWANLERNEPWCVAFARYCANQAGIVLKDTNSSTGLEKWYGENKKLSPSVDPANPKIINLPKAGDLAFVDNDGKPGIDHTAVVVEVNGDEITTVEGNLGPEANSLTIVKRKAYKYNSETGFVCTDGTGANIKSIGRN